jgi:hypothetical protein
LKVRILFPSEISGNFLATSAKEAPEEIPIKIPSSFAAL